ncbi:MAG: 4Fe-4S dicluster domain-containing protein [Clostridia bacterium]|nr:4Fe-4S dicluster domain-containing protein [Clostridia bacterium]
MNDYWHSVILEEDYCNGCTHCLDRCPTQAIRIVDGKAKIINERCIDCGECLKVCPFKAKGALVDGLEMLDNFKFNIALPSISLYGQFSKEFEINKLFNCFYKLGFDFVFDVAYAADLLVSRQLKKLQNKGLQKPLISTFCPAVVRLIQLKYPSLIDHIIPLETPMEVAARIVRQEVMEKTGFSYDEIGIFYITECPAKITSIKKPVGIEKSYVDGALSIESIYAKLMKIYDELGSGRHIESVQQASAKGIGWGKVGGQSIAMGIENYMAVDGVEEVIKVLDKVESGRISDVDFIEAYSCVTGCVGGPLNVENPFIAKSRIRQLTTQYPQEVDLTKYADVEDSFFEWNQEIEPLQVMKLDSDIKVALQKMTKIEELFQHLPGINCGACGAPTCRALAEDIVMGRASFEDCVVLRNSKKEGSEG